MVIIQKGDREKQKPDYINLERDWQKQFGGGSLAPQSKLQGFVATDYNWWEFKPEKGEKVLVLKVTEQPQEVRTNPYYCVKCGYRWDEPFCLNCCLPLN